jgi:hypothetical protein
MRNADTLDKIVLTYIGGLCRENFTYKGRQFNPKLVVVSPLLLRGYTCPAGCGACCGNFSLDYLPTEDAPETAVDRLVKINDRSVSIRSDRQKENSERWCEYLDREKGRCSIYQRRPFACDFELIRLHHFADRVLVLQKLYGRAWAMQRLDGDYGTLCEMTPPDDRTISEVVRKFERLLAWTTYFSVLTCIPEILDWIDSGRNSTPLKLYP